MIHQLTIIGVGLIGGSIARAARRKGLCRDVVGVDVDARNLDKAQQLGVIDVGHTDVCEGVRGADWVIIATPVGAFESLFRALRPCWSADAIYTDAGSTKLSVVNAARAVFGSAPPNFVPGHPIAGAECSGVEAATDDLYQGKRVILTPAEETDESATFLVQELWESIGAKVSVMSPTHHDEVLAATSHLPHVLAFTLAHMLGRKDETNEIFQYAAGGFRDFTRIASSDPRMWADICMANREQIAPLLQGFSDELKTVAELLKSQSAESLFDFFTDARGARQRFLNQLEK